MAPPCKHSCLYLLTVLALACCPGAWALSRRSCSGNIVDVGTSCLALSSLDRSSLLPAYVNSRVTFAVISYDVYGNRYTLEGLDFIVIVRKGSFARVWDAVSQCDGRYHVSGEFPFKGQYSIDVTTPSLGVHALGSPFLVNVGLLTACASTSRVTGNGLSVATAGVAASFTVTAVDAENEAKTVGNDGFAISIGRGGEDSSLATSYAATNLNNGKYSLSFTITASGAYQMSIRLGSVWEIPNSPFFFNVQTAAVSATTSYIVSAPDLTIVTVGQLATFVVVARDIFGNTLPFDAPALPSATFSFSAPGQLTINLNPITYSAITGGGLGYPTTSVGRLPAWSGSYLTTTSGSYTANIQIGGNHVTGSPYAITAASVTVSAFRIVCGTLSTVTNLVTTATIGAPVSLTITVKDMWSSNVAFFDSVMAYTPVIPYALFQGAVVKTALYAANGGNVAVLTLAGQSSCPMQTYPMINPGVASVGLQSCVTTPGVWSLTVGAVYRGGLHATYYNDQLLMVPYSSTVDTSWFFKDWGGSAPLGSLSRSDFGVRWSGYIRPNISAWYTIYLRADDGARLSLNDTVILDQWDNSLFRESVAVVYLDYQTMYPLTVTYHQNGILARISVQWESLAAGLDRQPLPTMNLYHSLTHLSGSPFSFTWSALTAIVLSRCRASFPATALITVWTVGNTYTFTVDLRDKYDNLVSTSQANLYFALLSYEVAGVYAHSSSSFATPSLASSLLTFVFTPLVSSTSNVQIRCGLLGSNGLFGTYYQDPDMKFPVSTEIAATLDMSDSGSSTPRWPTATYLLDNLQFAARWQGMITPTATGPYTFEAVIQDSDDRVRLWVSNAQLLNFWFENSTMKSAQCCTTANTMNVTGFSLLLGDPVTFSGVVPSGITASTVYYVFNPTPTTFQIRAAASTGSAIALTASPGFFFGYSPLIYRATFQFPTANVPYPITVDFFHSFNGKKIQLKWVSSAASIALGIVPSSAFSRIDPFPRFPYDVSIKPLGFCAATSLLSGQGLTIATLAFTSTFSITARDKFQNIVTDPALRFVAAARPSTPANLPASFASVRNAGMGVFAASLVPRWSSASANISLLNPGRPDLQCAGEGLSIGSIDAGLFASYYVGAYSASLSTTTTLVYFAPVADISGNAMGLSANPAFVARYRGVLTAPFTGTYTFFLITQGNTNSEMTRLTIATSVVIATVSTSTPCSLCVCAGGSCSFSGTFYMDGNGMYDILVEFQDTRTTPRTLALQWTTVPYYSASNIPSSVLSRESCANAFTQQPSGFQSLKGCAALTVASGNGLTLATAGAAATFSVTVKDSFGSVRGTTADIVPDMVFCNGTLGSGSIGDSHGWVSAAVHQGNGVHTCSFTTTRSGTYTVYNQVFVPGGLMGNYYGNYIFHGSPMSSSVSPVNFNWTSSITGVSDLSFTAAKYVGVFRPAYTQTYVLQVSMNAGDEVSLWIDGKLRLNASTFRQIANATDALVYGTSFFCTIALTSNVYYDLRLEYKDFGGPSFLQLQWQSTSQLPQVIPSSRLFWAVTTASFSTQVVKSSSTLATFTVGSTPPPLIASIYGNGLTATTAGVAAAFTLVTRDTYSNVRESADPAGSWRAVAWSDAGQIATPIVTPTLTFNSGIPGYVGAYTPQFAGNLSLQVSLSVLGGLIATYYPNVNLVDPKRVSFEANVQYASVNDDAESTVALATNWPGTAAVTMAHHRFSARWSGFIKATSTPTSPVTFFVLLGDTDDQARLYIDNVAIINRWDGAGVAGTVQTATPTLTGDQMYHIRLEYRETAGIHGVQLFWNGAVIPSTNLYMQQEVIGSRCCVSNAYPAPICGTTTVLSGVGLSLQTAGVVATYRMTLRDQYSNVRTLSSLGTDLNLAFQWFTSPIAPATLVVPTVKVNLTNLNFGVFSASYSVTSAGPSLLHVLSPIRGGLTATYYSGTSFSTASIYLMDTAAISFSGSTAAAAFPSYSAGYNAAMSARWQGYLRPRYAQVYTFYMTTLATTSGVALTIDNIAVISSLATPTAAAETSATFYFKKSELFYDIKVEFLSADTTSKALLLQWETSINTRTVAKSVIPTFRLFQQMHAARAPMSLTVHPNVACATRTVIALVAATAGYPTTFTITVRDSYGNPSDSHTVQVYNPLSGSPTTVNPTSVRFEVVASSLITRKVPLIRTAVGIWNALFTPPSPGGSMDVVVKVGLFGGLKGAYYDGTSFGRVVATRVDVVSFTWATVPVTYCMADFFSVRWSGAVFPNYAGTGQVYTFQTSTTAGGDEGVRLWVDGQLLIDAWATSSTVVYSNTVVFPVANALYDVKLDYKDLAATATIELKWKHLLDSSDAYVVIPSQRLANSESHIAGSPFSVPFQAV